MANCCVLSLIQVMFSDIRLRIATPGACFRVFDNKTNNRTAPLENKLYQNHYRCDRKSVVKTVKKLNFVIFPTAKRTNR